MGHGRLADTDQTLHPL